MKLTYEQHGALLDLLRYNRHARYTKLDSLVRAGKKSYEIAKEYNLPIEEVERQLNIDIHSAYREKMLHMGEKKSLEEVSRWLNLTLDEVKFRLECYKRWKEQSSHV